MCIQYERDGRAARGARILLKPSVTSLAKSRTITDHGVIVVYVNGAVINIIIDVKTVRSNPRITSNAITAQTTPL